MDEIKTIFSQIQGMIVNEDPDDDNKFLRMIWDLAAQGKEIAESTPSTV